MLFAEVAVEAARSAALAETYTYAVPDSLDVVPGHRVLVPFGRRTVRGYVVSLGTEDPGIAVKPIAGADREPLLLPHQVELARAVAAHYWAPLLECLRAMVPPRIRGGRSSGAGPSTRQRRHSRLLESARPRPAAGPDLTAEQRAAVDAIAADRRVLLHGITGSGKTEVYLAAAESVLRQGLRVLVLVPEISLTPQLLARFARLGREVAVLHSQLTELERAQQWWRVRRGEVDLVVGSRSAVFAPVARLGLIVVDEEGSSAYKQDRLPRYETGWVARRLAELAGSHLVLGSATPTVASYHEARSGAMTLARLTRRLQGETAQVELVDLREELARGHRMPLSRHLLQLVDDALGREEQAILFLNRRGLATFILCRECGDAVQCPQCSVAMVEHAELEGLACHYCGYTRPLPAVCPSCGSRQIRGMGMGTQRLEGYVKKLWPQARVLRLDRDTARGPDAYFEIFEAFRTRQADVLVGTQLVARGFDLEAVTAVGVVDADLPLHFPDYRSAENTFALVTQAAGRAGRSRRRARVVVQTSNPDHYALLRAAEQDYEGFYGDELPARRVFGFPPFGDLAVLTCSDADQDRAASAARDAADGLASAMVREGIDGIRVLGPSPAAILRLRGEYRWQLTLRGERLDRVRQFAPTGRGWSYDIDPVS